MLIPNKSQEDTINVAFISFEHPLGISGGGIGTYIGQISKYLATIGHNIEVFAANHKESFSFMIDNYWLHLIKCSDHYEFREKVAKLFAERHAARTFDLIECAEYGADAFLIKKQFPEIPLVVKLHTPTFLTTRLNEYRNNLSAKIRFIMGGLKKGIIVKPYWTYNKKEDLEFQLTQSADAVCSPSKSLADIVAKEWKLNEPVQIIPNIFVPSESFLKLGAPKADQRNFLITFLGRLEKRKGIFELMRAIPGVVRNHPNVIFRFIGKSHPSPLRGLDMEQYMKQKLSNYSKNLEFLGSRPYSEIPALLADSSICIFPSLWENFPNVCLEAMAGARAVIASSNGGMAEMIDSGKNGLLVPPKNPKAIANAITYLIDHPELIEQLGLAARKKVSLSYSGAYIGKRVESWYISIIKSRKKHSYIPSVKA